MQRPWDFAAATQQTPPASASSGTTAAALADIGAIDITGQDATNFLHNQLTQSIADLDANYSTLAAWCNAKGRVLALPRVYRIDEGLRLLLPRALIGGILRRLRLFVLRARVDIVERSDELGVIGVRGAGPGTSLPARDNAVQVSGYRAAIRLPGTAPWGLLVMPARTLADDWRALTGDELPGDAEGWTLETIRAGLPEIVPGTQERFVPQMLNLDVLGGLSYRKGCYPGQEVVARLYFRGGLKRRMYRIAGSGTPPASGTRVTESAGGEAGEVVRAAAYPGGGFEALAVLRMRAAERGDLHIDGQPATLLDLPYGFADPAVGEPQC